MAWTRRTALGAGAAILATASAADGGAEPLPATYGLITEIIAAPGRRNELAAILVRGAAGMAGCLSYVVAADAAKPDALWITEVWKDRESHAASLRTPAVLEAMTKGRPLVAGFASRTETAPIGGVGLPAP